MFSSSASSQQHRVMETVSVQKCSSTPKEEASPLSAAFLSLEEGNFSVGMHARMETFSWKQKARQLREAAPKTSPDGLKQPDPQRTEETRAEGYVLPLSVCVAVLLAAAVLLLYKWKLRRRCDGLTTRGQSRSRNSCRGGNVQVFYSHWFIRNLPARPVNDGFSSRPARNVLPSPDVQTSPHLLIQSTVTSDVFCFALLLLFSKIYIVNI
ncbi:uncharacterized protein LOC121652377 isoform X3 [Melanotaenia boesemani]|uniref:uncharacterized protein LOC121652377 isoform X3 n=1 Tax=Melanotaenia boesemani TaxID=1250792 RepID=UPI001C05A931|nr:uncharacterized protein LOC121652377 isoform X3 [Melanotaenia boesemani]